MTCPLVAGLLLIQAAPVVAQTKPESKASAPSAAAQTPATAKKASAGPFHGKLVAIDPVASSISVGKRTFYITSETRIQKAGVAARLQDGVVGEPCSGYVKPDENGRLLAKSVYFGAKPAAATSAKPPKSNAPAHPSK